MEMLNVDTNEKDISVSVRADRPLKVFLGYHKQNDITPGVEGYTPEFEHYQSLEKKDGPSEKQFPLYNNLFEGDFVCSSLKKLEGQLFTMLEGCITNESQLKAVKDIVRGYFSEYKSYVSRLAYRG